VDRLRSEFLLYVSDLLLNVTGQMLLASFFFEAGIIGRFAGAFFNLSRHFMNGTFDFVLCTFFHGKLLFPARWSKQFTNQGEKGMEFKMLA